MLLRGMKISFVGSGIMGGIWIERLIEAKVVKPEDIMACDLRAAVPLKRLQDLLPQGVAVVRIMPNTPFRDGPVARGAEGDDRLENLARGGSTEALCRRYLYSTGASPRARKEAWNGVLERGKFK